MTLIWDDPGDDTITGYVILRRVRVNDTGGDFDVLVADTGTAALTYTDDTVAASLTYTYRIKAINEHGVSERSRWSHIDTPAVPEAAEGDKQDGEDDGGGAPGKRANVSEGGTDCPQDTTTTCEVDVGDSVTGNTDSATDYDWFRVGLEAGTEYQIDLEGTATGKGSLQDPHPTLIDRSGNNSLDDDDNSGTGNNSRMTFTLSTAGTYYLQAFGSANTGTYRLSVRDITPPDDPVDLPDEIALVSNISQSHDGLANVFPPSNVIIGEARVAQRFTTGPSTGRYALYSVVLNLHTSLGTGHVPHVAVHANNSSGNPGTRLAVLDNPDDPIGDDTGSAGNRTFSAPSPLSLDANTSYWVVLTNITTTNSGIDASMTNSNNETTTQGFSIRNTRHVWTGDGPWRQAAGVKLRMEVRGTAVKQGFREGATDLPTDTSTTGVVEVDGPGARGTIAPPAFVEYNNRPGYDFDPDWFAVKLTEGRTYRIDMKGAIPTNELTLSLPQINAIYDADGDYLFNTFSRDESSAHHLFRVTFHARAGGTYYIAASGESFEWGGYELRVIDITQDTD